MQPFGPLPARLRLASLLAGVALLSPFPVSALPTPRPRAVPIADAAPRPGAAPQRSSANPEGFGPLDPAPPSGGLTGEQLVQKFAARETEFSHNLNEYTFTRSVKVQTISDDTGKPDGEYQDRTDIVLSDGGARTEHVNFAPANTLTRVMMSQSDFDDIEHRLPFVLTSADLPLYNITYLGRQKVDDLSTYVFDCAPKVMEKNKRYFEGKIWIDQQDYEIVLVNGKNVPDDTRRGHEDLSPPFTTYYSEVDGKNWFPIYTHAEGTLHFAAQQGAMANNVLIRYTVRYTDYKRFRAKSRIIYNGADLPAEAAPPATATPPKP